MLVLLLTLRRGARFARGGVELCWAGVELGVRWETSLSRPQALCCIKLPLKVMAIMAIEVVIKAGTDSFIYVAIAELRGRFG